MQFKLGKVNMHDIIHFKDPVRYYISLFHSIWSLWEIIYWTFGVCVPTCMKMSEQHSMTSSVAPRLPVMTSHKLLCSQSWFSQLKSISRWESVPIATAAQLRAKHESSLFSSHSFRNSHHRLNFKNTIRSGRTTNHARCKSVVTCTAFHS